MIDGFFDVVRGVPVIKPEALFVPEFKALWEGDKSKDKHKATRQISYIYHSVNPMGPYGQLDPFEKEELTKRDLLKEGDETPELIAARDKYRYLLIESDVDMQLVEGVTEALRKIAIYLKDVIVVDGKGGNVGEINASIKNASLMRGQRNQLLKEVQEGIEAQKNIKRNVRPNIFDEDL